MALENGSPAGAGVSTRPKPRPGAEGSGFGFLIFGLLLVTVGFLLQPRVPLPVAGALLGMGAGALIQGFALMGKRIAQAAGGPRGVLLGFAFAGGVYGLLVGTWAGAVSGEVGQGILWGPVGLAGGGLLGLAAGAVYNRIRRP